jgi:hypothetical protein
LTAEAGQRDSWPGAAQIVEAAELAGDSLTTSDAPDPDPSGGRSQRPKSRPLLPAKLLGALTSAAVTAVVIVIATVVGAVVLRGPHQQPTTPPGRTGGSLTFHRLPLGPHWQGRAFYSVSNGVVYLEGRATLDRSDSQPGPVATLPPSARPGRQLHLVAVLSGGDAAIKIGANGQIRVARSVTHLTWVSLGGVAFPLGSR